MMISEDIDRILNTKPKSNIRVNLDHFIHSPWMFPVLIIILIFGAIGAFIYTIIRHILPNIAMEIYDKITKKGWA